MNLVYSLQNIDSEYMERLEHTIHTHPAWHGHLNGMACEALLRGAPPLSYLLRAGEERFHFYLSFVYENSFSFKHQPFILDKSSQGWFYRNGGTRYASSLEELIPLILHCEAAEGLPIAK